MHDTGFGVRLSDLWAPSYLIGADLGRLIRQSLTSRTADTIQRFQEDFARLKKKFNTAVAIQTLNVAVGIVGLLRKQNLGSIEAAITDKADEGRCSRF
jgi:hypothetical protein